MRRIASGSVLVMLAILISQTASAFSFITPAANHSLTPTFLFQDDNPYFLRVSGWEFQVTGAEIAGSFNGEFSLGHLEDGRSWLVVYITGKNTSSDSEGIHSDSIQLRHHGEMIKQTGAETDLVAEALGIQEIGGTLNTVIPAGDTFDFVQVYKVKPNALGLQLQFDFNGTWNIAIDSLIVRDGSNANTVDETGPFSVQTNSVSVELLGAVSAPTFSGPFHLGNQSDGNTWTVVLLSIETRSSDDVRASDYVSITVGNDSYQADSKVTEDVAEEVGIYPGTDKLSSQSGKTPVVLVFRTPAEMDSTVLRIDDRGSWYMDLSSVLTVADGSPAVIDPDNPMDLTDVSEESVFVPTAAPTPTLEPTPAPVFGSLEKPATIGDTIEVEGFSITLEKVSKTDSLSGGYITPRGGAIFIVINVKVTRISEDSGDVSAGDFTLWNPDTDKTYSDSSTVFAAQPFESADLARGEYTYGQIVFEVPETADLMVVQFRPSIWGDTGYWGFRM